GGKAGGADHTRQLLCSPIGSCRHRACRGGKVDEYAPAGELFKRVKDGDLSHLPIFTVHAGYHPAIGTGGDFFEQRAAHTAVNSLNDNIRHGFIFLSKCKAGPRKQCRGPVAGYFSNPKSCMAALIFSLTASDGSTSGKRQG